MTRQDLRWQDLLDDPMVVQLADELRHLRRCELITEQGKPLPSFCHGLEQEYLIRRGEHRQLPGRLIALAVLELMRASDD